MKASIVVALFVCVFLIGASNGFHFSSTNARISRLIVSSKTSIHAVSAETEEGTVNKAYSFVNQDLRTYAMRFHTKDQAPKEGKQKAEVPFTAWEPTRQNYVQFLVDSLLVYETLESLAQEIPALAPFKATGLERAAALKEDLEWMTKFDSQISIPTSGPNGIKYSNFLRKLAAESIPKFMCHYYNHYFAHTAGGRMIGRRMADKLLESNTLKFYQWESGDVKVLLDNTRVKIDEMAVSWNAEEKQACLEETLSCFMFGSSLMSYIRPPPVPKAGGCPVPH